MEDFEHPPIIKTDRLILRQWSHKDLEPFAQLNADPRVMEYFPSLKSKEESDHSAFHMAKQIEKFGWGLWAACLASTGEFIGFIGLQEVPFETNFTPAVEIGWRLAFKHWGKGYATEGALASLRYGFETLHLNEIVSFTAINNTRSRRLMEKLGMFHDKINDFDHPKLPGDHPLKRHALYRIRTGYFTKIWESPPENFQPRVEVAACYVEVGGRILLLERALNSAEGKTWGVAAGKMETGETPNQAARRELFEETGIRATPSQIEEIGKLYIQKPRGDFIYHMFQVHLKEVPKVILSDEHTKYLWASSHDIDILPLVGGGKEALDYFARMKK